MDVKKYSTDSANDRVGEDIQDDFVGKEEIVVDRFDTDHEECEYKGRKLQTEINHQSDQLIQTINQSKNTYLDLIEKHRRASKPS